MVSSVLDEFGMPIGYYDRAYRNLESLVARGVMFDDTSPFWDYDFAEFIPLNFTPGDSLQGIDANNVYRYHYLTPDELTWAQVRYTRDAAGKWKPSSAVQFGREQSSNFGNFLKFAAPLFLVAIPGVGQAIGGAAFSAVGATVSPGVAAALGNVAISTALNGGDIERAVVNALAGGLGASAGAFAGAAVDSAIVGKIVANLTTTAATGGDIKAALISTLAQTGASKMSDYFNSFDFNSGADLTSADDWLVPGSGSIKYDSTVFENPAAAPDNWSLTTQQAIDNYDLMYGTINTAPPETFDFGALTSGYHDPVYTEDDSITPSDTNYGGGDFGAITPLPGFEEPGAPYVNPPHIDLTRPTANATESGSDWLGSIVTGVTALAQAAIKLVPTIAALKNADIIKSGSLTSGNSVVTANNNGTITTRNQNTGAVSTTIPPIGKAYQTPDGNIITNNGNGTYTVVKPDGTRYTGNYTATSTTGGLTTGAGSGFFSNPQNVMLAGGALLAVLLLSKGK